KRQARLVDLDVVIRDDVDVEGARTPPGFALTVAPERSLDLERPLQQSARRKLGFDHEREVYEGRLLGHAPGRRAVVRRACQETHLAAVTQRRDGTVER